MVSGELARVDCWLVVRSPEMVVDGGEVIGVDRRSEVRSRNMTTSRRKNSLDFVADQDRVSNVGGIDQV